MFKFISHWLERTFGHTHCFCDKKMDKKLEDGTRMIVMACNKCGLEDVRFLNSTRK